MLHTQYVFVYGDTCILVINFAPPKVKSWLRHCYKPTYSYIRFTYCSSPQPLMYCYGKLGFIL